MTTEKTSQEIISAPGTRCCSPGVLALPPEERLASSAAVLKTLGHPVRLKILHVLHEQGSPVCACDIEAHFDLSQPTISHHLRLLREAGLVEGDQRGPWVYYRICPAPLRRIEEELAHLAP